MRIATWNINSVRLRKEMVLKFLQDYKIDILCLQETKTMDEHFPVEFFSKAGYANIIFSGEKSYNGVAIISKVPLISPNIVEIVNGDKRHISAGINVNGDKLELHNFYIPAGGDEPDPEINPKFKHKLDYVDEMGSWFANKRSKDDGVIILGDFNIAPYEHDVWSHKQLLKIVSHTPVEVEKLLNMKNSLGFSDVARNFVPESEKLYSWWSYRNRDWKKSNRGRRLDHIWVTKPLEDKVKEFEVHPHIRDWEKPSDHVPVIIEL